VISLLDVNVLVALFDAAHVHHETAHEWFGRTHAEGWATCPLTENGFARVVSSTAYPGRRTTVADALDRLHQFRQSDHHVFWADSLSLCGTDLVDPAHIAGSKQITDTYLLALAVKQNGTLATFDRTIPLKAVAAAERRHLTVLGRA
jgi:toxin-antitoxin system PIN domain toxin